MEGAQHSHRFDGSERKFRRHVVGDACESDNLKLKSLTGGDRAFVVYTSVALQTNR